MVSAAFLASGGDRLHAGQRHGAPGERLEQEEDPQRLRAERDRVWRCRELLHRPRHDPGHPDGHDPECQPDEQVGRDREDVPGFAQAAEVRDGDQPDRDECDLDAYVVGGREDRLDLGDRGCGGDGDGHDVVDQERRGGDQPEDGRQVRLGHDVRAAAVRIRAADLAVGDRDDREEERDRDRDLDREEQRTGPREDQDPEDLLGRVRRRRDRVRAEDRERLLLRQALFQLVLVRQRPTEDDGPEPGESPAATRSWGGRRLTGDHLVGAGIPEERGVRPLDADPAVARLSALERLPTPDHGSVSDLAMTGGRSLGPMTRLTGAGGSRRRRNAMPAACAQTAPVNAAPSAASKQHSVMVTATPAKTSEMATSISSSACSSGSPAAEMGRWVIVPSMPLSVSARRSVDRNAISTSSSGAAQ